MFAGLDDEFFHSLVKHALNDKSAPKRWHITRVQMYRRLEKLLEEHDSASKKCLCISHSKDFAEILGLKETQKVAADYPEYDIRKLEFPDSEFDFVVSDQVLEHIEGDPIAAVAETVRVLKPGGFFVHTTCFINFIHQPPLDFWRFTPAALELISRTVGCEVVQVDGWGSRAAWTYMQMGYRMEKIPESSSNPLFKLATESDKRWPVTTWVAARKPLVKS